MDLYVLLGFGFAVLVFILIFRRKQTKTSKQILEGNVNVKPLFQERWAKLQNQSLHESAATERGGVAAAKPIPSLGRGAVA